MVFHTLLSCCWVSVYPLLLFYVTASPVPAGRQVSSVLRIFKKLLSLFTFHLYKPYSVFLILPLPHKPPVYFPQIEKIYRNLLYVN